MALDFVVPRRTCLDSLVADSLVCALGVVVIQEGRARAAKRRLRNEPGDLLHFSTARVLSVPAQRDSEEPRSLPGRIPHPERNRMPEALVKRLPFAVIVPTQDELEAVEQVFPNEPCFEPHCGSIRALRLLRVSGHLGILAWLDAVGRLSAALAAAELLRRWSPLNLLLVGRCGGAANDEVRLGDIVIADRVRDYEFQTLRGRDSKIHWELDYELDGCCLQTVHGAVATWRPPAGVGSDVPTVHVGTVLSGDKIVASSEYLGRLSESQPFIAVEMEAGGVVKAIEDNGSQTNLFVVRGVSDIADETKDHTPSHVREQASRVAAEFARHLLEDLLRQRS